MVRRAHPLYLCSLNFSSLVSIVSGQLCFYYISKLFKAKIEFRDLLVTSTTWWHQPMVSCKLLKPYIISSLFFWSWLLFLLSEAWNVCVNVNICIILLQSCFKVALDFVSPEHVGECIRLTEEFRKLPINHKASEDKFEVCESIFNLILLSYL